MAANTEDVVKEVIDLSPLLIKNILRPMETCSVKRVPPNQLNILNLLQQQGTQSMAQLGRQIIVCRQQMTQLIDELHKKHFVERKADETDRRTVNIAITDQGRKYLAAHNAAMGQELYQIFDGYTDEQKDGLIQTARKMRVIMNG